MNQLNQQRPVSGGVPRTARALAALAWMLIAVCTASVPAAEIAPGLTEQQLAQGWISLFDGESLFGWQPAGSADWRVEDRAIVVSEGDVSLLCTRSQFADYVLRVDFKAEPSTNSGLFLRTSPKPANVAQDCYELNIAPPDNPFPTGSLVQRKRTAMVPTSGQWQTFEARLEAGQVTIRLDGQVVLEYDDPQPLGRGFIGLQHNQGRVAFRNIYLKPLGLASLLNGRNLQGWTRSASSAAKFTVTPEGELSIDGGKGHLESDLQLQDFVLQMEAKTLSENSNSGLFFRCIPGQELMGYESQIHHGIVDGDRSRPADGGTGAIFRRQNARRVLTDDDVWFYKTLVVDGPHIGVWVNGLPVTDWTDTRKADANPRRGRRLEAGTLMLQGHDAGTSLLIRKLGAVELPARRVNP
jgi:hypothetical protein